MAQFDIFITHVPSNTQISFKPFLTAFSDNFKSDWNQSYVMGRMDSIPTFKRTTRVINISFDVPASSVEEGRSNLESSRQLAKFLYPVYKEYPVNGPSQSIIDEKNVSADGIENQKLQQLYQKQAVINTLESQLELRPVAIMSSGPILAMKFANLVATSTNEKLYGYLDGFIFKPDREAGFFVECQSNELIPKSFSIDLTFNVIHTEPLGWNDVIDFKNPEKMKRSGPWR